MITEDGLKQFFLKRGIVITRVIPPGKFIVFTNAATEASSIYNSISESSQTPVEFIQIESPKKKGGLKWVSAVLATLKSRMKG